MLPRPTAPMASGAIRPTMSVSTTPMNIQPSSAMMTGPARRRVGASSRRTAVLSARRDEAGTTYKRSTPDQAGSVRSGRTSPIRSDRTDPGGSGPASVPPEIHRKRRRNEMEQRVHLADAAAQHGDGGIRQQAVSDAVGDGVGERDHQDGDEGGQRGLRLAEVDARDRQHHHEP